MKLKEWFTDESKWTQKAYYRDELGNDYLEVPSELQCCCLVGALRMCYNNSSELRTVRHKISSYINMYRQRIIAIVDWNDSDYTTFEDVKKLVNELDI